MTQVSSEVSQCVEQAFSWLLSCPISEAKIKAIDDALLAGNFESNWNVDDKLYEKLLIKSLDKFPAYTQHKLLSELLIGLGELSARCHVQCEEYISDILSDDKYRCVLPIIIDQAISVYEIGGYNYSDDDMSTSSVIRRSKLDVETLKLADRICNRIGGNSGGRYGLHFITRLFFNLDIVAFSNWFNENESNALYRISVELSENLVFEKSKEKTNLLIKQGSNFLKILAVSALTLNFDNKHKFWGIEELASFISSAGIDKGDAVWMAMHCLKRSDLVINDLALVWPEEGLTDHQLEQLNYAFDRDRSEIRYSIAESIQNDSNKKLLLTQNVNDFKKYVGITKGISDDSISFNQYDDNLVIWAAKSFVELHKNDDKELSRIVGSLVGSFSKKLENFISQPYMSVRQVQKWQYSTSRLAIIHYFVVNTYYATPDEHKQDIESLFSYAIDHIVMLLKAIQECWCPLINDLPDHLSRVTASVLRDVSSIRVKQEDIILEKNLPDYFRALVIWGNPSLIENNINLASSLFQAVGKFTSNRSLQNRNFNRILNLLDVAIASAESKDQQKVIINLWENVCQNWGGVLDKKWQVTAAWLVGAVNGDQDAIDQLQDSDELNNCLCFHTITKNQTVDTCIKS